MVPRDVGLIVGWLFGSGDGDNDETFPSVEGQEDEVAVGDCVDHVEGGTVGVGVDEEGEVVGGINALVDAEDAIVGI